MIEADAKVVSTAAPPSAPSTPGPKLFGAVGFTASLMLGTLLALLMERFDSGLRSATAGRADAWPAGAGLGPQARAAEAQSEAASIPDRQAALGLRRIDPGDLHVAATLQCRQPAAGRPDHLVPAAGRQDDAGLEPGHLRRDLWAAGPADGRRPAPSQRASRPGRRAQARAGRIYGGRGRELDDVLVCTTTSRGCGTCRSSARPPTRPICSAARK